MILTKLGYFTIRLGRKNQLLRRLAVHQPKTLSLPRNNNSTLSDKKKDENEDELDQPIKYSSSEAAKWSALASRVGRQDVDDRPWYQSIVVMASVAVFMIYFCILREENDVDDKLTWNLSDHFEGEKKANIETSQQIYWDYVGKPAQLNPEKPKSS